MPLINFFEKLPGITQLWAWKVKLFVPWNETQAALDFFLCLTCIQSAQSKYYQNATTLKWQDQIAIEK